MDARIAEESWRGERRLHLLEAAAGVFARVSYERASMDDIAQAAGVGKPTLYRYFPSKDALFAAVFEQALDDLEDRMDAVLDLESRVEARLLGLVSAMVPTFRAHLVALRFLGADAAAVDQSQRRIFRERRARIAAVLARAVEEGRAAGEVRGAVDAARISHLVIGMIWSGTSSVTASDEEIAGEVVQLVLHGIREPGGNGASLASEARQTTPSISAAARRSRETAC